MKIAFFDTHAFERDIFSQENGKFHQNITFLEPKLNVETAVLASSSDVVCSFVNDKLDANVLSILKRNGVRLVALRSAGFNHVDLEAAAKLILPVVRVPEYSPYAVAEHAVTLILSLNRKIHRSYNRVREQNFTLEGLVGFDLHGKTVGILGTGKIGSVMAKIMTGFGCKVLAYDVRPNATLLKECPVTYVTLSEIWKQADIISLHLPLTPETHHLIDAKVLEQMKPGAMLINTGRGGLIESGALIAALKSGHLGYAGLDVYEEEEFLFFRDLSDQILQDDVMARLLTFPNVLITAHQAFLTREALQNIAATTLQNISDFEKGLPLKNEVHAEKYVKT